jgi:hypothetical protein
MGCTQQATPKSSVLIIASRKSRLLVKFRVNSQKLVALRAIQNQAMQDEQLPFSANNLGCPLHGHGVTVLAVLFH